MERQNITLSIPRETLKKAKHLAVAKDQSLSGLLTAQILTDLGQWRLHEPTLSDLKRAIELEKLHKLSFWDAIIVSSAQQMGCKLLWTEDLNSGQYIAVNSYDAWMVCK